MWKEWSGLQRRSLLRWSAPLSSGPPTHPSPDQPLIILTKITPSDILNKNSDCSPAVASSAPPKTAISGQLSQKSVDSGFSDHSDCRDTQEVNFDDHDKDGDVSDNPDNPDIEDPNPCVSIPDLRFS